MSADHRDWRFRAQRPTLTMPFMGGLSLWAGCAVSFAGSRMQSSSQCLYAALICAAVAAAIVVVALFSRKPVILLAVMLALGCVLGFGQGWSLHAVADNWNAQHVTCVLMAREDSSESSYGERCLVSLRLQDGREIVASATFREGCELRYGERANVSATVSASDFAGGDYDWNRGAALSVKVGRFERLDGEGPGGPIVSARSAAIDALEDGSSDGALMQALVCGYRRGIRGSPLYSSFQSCGLAHLVAVSGAHLVIVTGLFAAALRALGAPRKLSVAVLVIVMFSYLVFSGAPVSAVRACVMSGVGSFSLFARRRPSALNALGVCLVGIICASPSSSVSVSLALSTLSTVGIVVLSPLLSGLIDSTPLGNVPLVADSLVLTLSASLLTQPFACSLFGKLPLIAPLANIACTPLFPVCCALGLIAAVLSLIGGPAGSLVAIAARCLASALGWLATAFSSVPYSSIPICIGSVEAIILSVLVAAVLWLAWSDKAPVAIAAGMAFACCVAVTLWIPSDADRIVMFDVGQGDAFLVQSRGRTLLVDTGNQDAKLLAGLGANGIAHIDSVLVTHADDDHCGSLDAIAQSVDVDRVLLANGVEANSSQACSKLVSSANEVASQIVELSYGDSFRVGAFTFTVVWPHALVDDAGNADSLCLLVEYDGDADGAIDVTALFTGDAEEEQIGQVIEESGLSSVDILKVGHHGSRNAFTKEQVKTLGPRIALIGVGLGNRYGHPAPETLEALENAGCEIYRTDRDGEVRCTLAPDSVRVTTMK